MKQTRRDDNLSRASITCTQILLYLCSSRLENMQNALILPLPDTLSPLKHIHSVHTTCHRNFKICGYCGLGLVVYVGSISCSGEAWQISQPTSICLSDCFLLWSTDKRNFFQSPVSIPLLQSIYYLTCMQAWQNKSRYKKEYWRITVYCFH